MTCAPCMGLMVLDQFYDFRDDQHEFEFTGWHCPNCGEILDPVLVENRRTSGTSDEAPHIQSLDRGLENLVAEDRLIEVSLKHG